jgi:hypothetical protein
MQACEERSAHPLHTITLPRKCKGCAAKEGQRIKRKQHQDDIVLQLREAFISTNIRLEKWQSSDRAKLSKSVEKRADFDEGVLEDVEIEKDEIWDDELF